VIPGDQPGSLGFLLESDDPPPYDCSTGKHVQTVPPPWRTSLPGDAAVSQRADAAPRINPLTREATADDVLRAVGPDLSGALPPCRLPLRDGGLQAGGGRERRGVHQAEQQLPMPVPRRRLVLHRTDGARLKVSRSRPRCRKNALPAIPPPDFRSLSGPPAGHPRSPRAATPPKTEGGWKRHPKKKKPPAGDTPTTRGELGVAPCGRDDFAPTFLSPINSARQGLRVSSHPQPSSLPNVQYQSTAGRRGPTGTRLV